MLREHLNQLFRWLNGRDAPESLRVVDDRQGHRDANGYLVIPASALKSADEFEADWAELMREGFNWVNLSYYGDLGGVAVIVVETPWKPSGTPATSVNYSGPSTRVAAQGNDASSLVQVVDDPDR